MRLAALLSKLSKLIMPTPYEPLETFTLFPKLPIEIRLNIWKLLCTHPRKVKLFYYQIPDIYEKPRLIHGQSKHPAVLEVNHESRAEGLRFYTLCQELIRDRTLNSWLNYVYINFENDRFSFDYACQRNGGSSLSFDTPVLRKIKYVEVGSHGTLEEGNMRLDYLSVIPMLLQTDGLVELRAVMTHDGIGSAVGNGSVKDTFSTSLIAHERARRALDKVTYYSQEIIMRCREILIAHYKDGRAIPSIHAKFSAVFSPEMGPRRVSDYGLEDLDNSSLVVTLVDI